MSKFFVCDTCGTFDHLEVCPQQPSGVFKCTVCAVGTWHNHFPMRKYNPDKDIVCNRPNGTGISFS